MMHDLPKHRFHDPEGVEREFAHARHRVRDRKWYRQAAAARTDMACWYVAQTNRLCPIEAAKQLNDAEIEAWCPVDRDKKRAPRRHGKTLTEWAMFAGYFFVRIDPDPISIRGVCSFEGIVGLLGEGGVPSPMPDKMVNELKLFLHLTPKQRRLIAQGVQIGETVKIRADLWNGWRGPVVEVDRKNGFVSIELDIFGRLTPVRIGLDEIEK